MGVEKVGKFAGTLVSTTKEDVTEWQYDKILEVLDMDIPKMEQWGPFDEITRIIDNINGKLNTWKLQQHSEKLSCGKLCFWT